MQALFFEVLPRPGHEGQYFDRAAALRPRLETNPGFLFIDRFMSLARPGLVLSHSLWKDEASLASWRTDAKHHVAQTAGRNVHFADYRLRIAQVIRATSPDQAVKQWPEENAYNDPDLVPRRHLAVVESTGAPFDEGGESFSSVNRDDTFISLVPVEGKSQGEEVIAAAVAAKHVDGAKLCLISRDYGMFDRKEAPQYFPPAEAEQSAAS